MKNLHNIIEGLLDVDLDIKYEKITCPKFKCARLEELVERIVGDVNVQLASLSLQSLLDKINELAGEVNTFLNDNYPKGYLDADLKALREEMTYIVARTDKISKVHNSNNLPNTITIEDGIKCLVELDAMWAKKCPNYSKNVPPQSKGVRTTMDWDDEIDYLSGISFVSSRDHSYVLSEDDKKDIEKIVRKHQKGADVTFFMPENNNPAWEVIIKIKRG